jgi:hypothetical protein
VDPRYYSVDVYAGTRRLDDQRLLVVIDWWPNMADITRRQLNAQLRAVAMANRAMGSDLREYSLRAFDVDNRGERIEMTPSWTWRYQPDQVEGERDGWWRL